MTLRSLGGSAGKPAIRAAAITFQASTSEPASPRQVTLPSDGPTGVFLREEGGTYPW